MSKIISQGLSMSTVHDTVWGSPLNLPTISETEPIARFKKLNSDQFLNTFSPVNQNTLFQVNFGGICCWFSGNTLMAFSNIEGTVYVREALNSESVHIRHVKMLVTSLEGRLCSTVEFIEAWKLMLVELTITDDIESVVKNKLIRQNKEWKETEETRTIKKSIRKVKLKNADN